MTKKVALIARGPSSRYFPGKDYGYDQVWTLNRLVHQFEKELDCLFVMDDLKLRSPFYGQEGAEFTNWLVKEYKGRVITSHLYEELPDNFEAFPIEESCKTFGVSVGTAYYSTPDYMISLAIMEGFDQIDMFGIDVNFTDEKGLEQMRCCTALWIGVATGKGVIVRSFTGSFYEYFLNTGLTTEQGLYGYALRPRIENLVTHYIELDGDGVKYSQKVQDLLKKPT